MLNDLLKNEKILVLLLVAVVVLIYARVLDGPFVFDDNTSIKDNSHIRITSLSLKNLAEAAIKSPLKSRPVSYVGFSLNYYFHRYNVFGYHLTNIILHALAGIVLFFTTKATLQTPALLRWSRKYQWVPLFTAFIWVVHPVQTQTVSYIVQRMTGQTALFYLLALFLYIKARQSCDYRKPVLFVGSTIAGFLAIGSKEIAATLPFFIMLYEWYFFQKLDFNWLKKRIGIMAGVLLIIGLVAFLYLGHAPLDRIFSGYASRDFTPIERILTQLRVIGHYIGLLFWPSLSRLNLDYDFALSHSLTDPMMTSVALAFIAALLLLSAFYARKEPLLSFGILWFFGNLLIESSIIPLELVFEHRLYLPSMFAVAGMVSLLFGYQKTRRIGIVVLSVFIAVSASWTYQRNAVWADPLLIWYDSTQKSPHKARPHLNLGIALMERGEKDAAVTQYRHALKLDPENASAHYNLGSFLVEQGRLTEGIQHLQAAVRIKPKMAMAHNNLGLARMIQGKLTEAEQYLKEAIRLQPAYAELYNNLGIVLRKQERFPEAITTFTKALHMNPDFAEAHNNLGYTYKLSGDNKAATRHFKEALRIKPDYEKARSNLETMNRSGND